ncbi:MAG TPA: P-loop NTPase [Ktedonobacteraceae bacterium]|nr:P-loop NTPase [Ktedonobacteraceae bacterium]
MTFAQYLNVLIKRWPLIVLCLLLVGSGAYIGSKLMVRYYQSSALVEVVIRSSANNPSDYNNVLASQQLVQTEVALATSYPVLQEVVSHYPSMTVAQLSTNVTAATKLNTQLFTITVQDPSPTRAARLANDIAQTLINQQIAAAQQANMQAQAHLQQESQDTQNKLAATITHLGDIEGRPGSNAEIIVLQAQIKSLQQYYNGLQDAMANLETAQAQQGNILQLAQAAQPVYQAVKPNTLLNTGAGLAVGALFGILLALLLEQLDTRIRSPEMLTALLDWPLLATIWRARSSLPEDLINPVAHDINIEAYRMLRANIGFIGVQKPLRTLAITSALPGEGKSTIASNLAIFLAKSGKNTLLVDADLRHPSLRTYFKLAKSRKGLSNALLAIPTTTGGDRDERLSSPPTRRQTSPLAPVVLDTFTHATDIPNLWLMPSGPPPPNPPELLDSPAMQQLLTLIINSAFEVIIFDTPPATGLSDTSLLASRLDGTLVVVDIAKTRRGPIKKLKAQFTQAGLRVIGCVVNKQRRHHKDAYGSYYSDNSEEQFTAESESNEPQMAPASNDALHDERQDDETPTLKAASVASEMTLAERGDREQ